MARQRIRNIPYSLDHTSGRLVNLGSLGTWFEGLDQDFAMTFWVKYDTLSFVSPFGNTGTGARRVFVNMNRTTSPEGAIELFMRDVNSNTINVWFENAAIPRGQWAHIIINKTANNGAGIDIRVNNTSQASTVDNSAGVFASDADATNFYIGGIDAVSTRDFEGRTAEMYLYQRALTEAEMSSIYNDGIYPTDYFRGYDYSDGAGTALTDLAGVANGTLDNANMWLSNSPMKARTQIA